MKLQKGALPMQGHHPIEQKAIEDKTMQAAKMFEKHFLREMVQAMRKTVPRSGLVKESMAEKIFSEKLDGEYVESWGNKGGIGLSKMIYDQVMARFGKQMGHHGSSPASGHPKGPLPFNKGAIEVNPQAAKKGGPIAFNMKKVQGGEIMDVLMPWKGILLNTESMGQGLTKGQFKHDNGLQSEFVFKGDLIAGSRQQKIEAGQKIGLMGADANRFFWKLSEARIEAHGLATE